MKKVAKAEPFTRWVNDLLQPNPEYNDETSRRAGKNLECGDLSPLLPLWRLVAKAGPRPAARESWTPFRIGRRQVACRKRGQVRALQSGCGSAALGSSVSIRGFDSVRPFQLPEPGSLRFALGYYLPGLRPFRLEPRHLGFYGAIRVVATAV